MVLNDFGEYVPVNASSEKWLTVSYLAEGADFVQESRRKEAYKKCMSTVMANMS
ncbi:hypothetical protein ACOIWJ_000997 [Vibrio parahaemolyticus]